MFWMERKIASINLWDHSQLLTLQALLFKRHLWTHTNVRLRLTMYACISRSMKAIWNSRWHFKYHLPQLSWARGRVQAVLIFHQWRTVWKVMFIKTFLCWLSAAPARSKQGVKALGEAEAVMGEWSLSHHLRATLNEATLPWEMERNLMMPVCVGYPGPEDAQVQRMTESHFSRLRLICVSITLWEIENARHTSSSQVCGWTTLHSQWYSP